jgi:hypothetical protein
MDGSVASKAVIDTARLVNKVVSAELLLALAIVVTRLSAGDKFRIPGTVTEIQTKYAWIVFAAFSVGHLYVTILFRRACGTLFYTEHQNARATWEELTKTGPRLVCQTISQQMVQRQRSKNQSLDRSHKPTGARSASWRMGMVTAVATTS